jgi:molybdenum cofactor guanylyltransferase
MISKSGVFSFSQNQEASVILTGHNAHGSLSPANKNTLVYGRNECAILGTTCEAVADFYSRVVASLPRFCVALADASHDEFIVPAANGMRYTERGTTHSLEGLPNDPSGIRKFDLTRAHVVIVNGNHFEASRQLIIPHPGKEASLRKRAAQLTNPIAIYLPSFLDSVPEWVSEVLGERKVPVFREGDAAGWQSLLGLVYQPPPLRGLILAGGRSSRMGRDKNLLDYHGMRQFEFLAGELRKAGLQVAVSCRSDQVELFRDSGMEVIEDRLNGMGPIAGILSAFMHSPDDAWLVAATDLPGWDEQAARQLIAARDISASATVFHDQNNLPEPLCGIWEPQMYARILRLLYSGVTCPRKVLRLSSVHSITPAHPDFIRNINTPDEESDFRQSYGA